MKLKTEWELLRRRIDAALHPAKPPDSEGPVGYGEDDCEWVVVYRTATGYCCIYQGRPINFDDLLDVRMWTEKMDVRPYFMGL